MAPSKAVLKDGRKALRILVVVAGAVVLAAAALNAAGAEETAPMSSAGRELIPGAEQMTPAERDAYRQRMQDAQTPEERERIRAEYSRALKQHEAVPTLVGDPKRGAELHRACFGCHGVERYTQPVTRAIASFYDSVLRASGLSDLPPQEPKRFKGRIQSLEALRAAVLRRNEFFSPKMTPQEVEDVVAYLNVTYYKFGQRVAEKQD